MTLYELTDQFMTLLSMMEDADEDADTIIDTADAIEMDFNDKADAYAKVISIVNGDVDTISAEIERLQSRKRALQNNAARLKDHLQKAMEATGKTKFKTALFSFNVQNNPASVVLDAVDVWKLPEDYIRYKDPEIDKKKIAADLKKGIELPGIAHLEQTRSLRIR